MSDAIRQLFGNHPRQLADNCFVYAVVSRRSRGVSIGINLNPDRRCHFDCVYCQIDRSGPAPQTAVDLPRLLEELEDTLDRVLSGQLFELPMFAATPASLRRLNDIAFSGEGEPTACRLFPQAVHTVVECKQRRGLQGVKLVLLTNAVLLHRPEVRAALQVLTDNEGEIWAKLDAGTEAYYQRMDRSSVPFSRVLENIRKTAGVWPVVIQSMFLRLDGEAVAEAEVDALAERLCEILRAGGQIRLVQAYTVARRPAEENVQPLSNEELEAVARRLHERTGLPVETFGAT